MADPELLLLDEPTAGMGPEETKDMVALIETLAAERTILLVEHKMKMILGLSDRILVLHHGRLIADGSPQRHPDGPGGPSRLSGTERWLCLRSKA